MYLAPIPILLAIFWGFSQMTASSKTIKVEPFSYAFTLSDTSLLKPKENHPKKAKILVDLMKNHYSHITVNEKISVDMFEAYIKALDNQKVYFVQNDIKTFEKYKKDFAQLLQQGNVEIAFQIFNAYKQNTLARINQNLKDLDRDLDKVYDFTKDEEMETDREKSSWAKDKKELDKIWEQRLKNEVLSLKLGKKNNEDIKKTLTQRYERYKKSISQINSEDVFQIIINAFTESYDPHTNYFSPVNAQNFQMNMKKSFEGIGARLTVQDDYTVINEVMPGGPASKGKELKKGDKIVAIAQGENGEFEDVVGWRIDDVIGLIRGQKNTMVRLKVIPANSVVGAPQKVIKIMRDKIKIEDESVTKKIVKIKKNGKDYKLGIIEVPSFYIDFKDYQSGNPDYKSTSGDVRKIIKELKKEGIDGLLMDLRNNGGGSLKEAIDLTGLFIKTGAIVQVKDADGSIEAQPDKNEEIAYDGELAVLVNNFSASASEIFAGAIQDYKRGVILGEQTFGKGTVQSPIDLANYMRSEDPNQGQINLTLSKFYRITGSSTQNRGVMPDVSFPMVYDRTEVSESAERSALPWDEIRATRFTATEHINNKTIDKLKKSFEKELKTDEKLKKTVADVEEARKLRKRTKISLQETKRKKELDDFEKKQENKKQESKAQTKVEEKKPENPEEDVDVSEKILNSQDYRDVYLQEALELLAEMIKK